MAFIILRYVSSVLLSRETFFLNHTCMLNFIKSFSASIQRTIWFLFFSLLMWYTTLIDLWVLKNPCPLPPG